MSGVRRTARLNEQLRREISELIRREVRDPRVGHATIAGVDVARDLGSAKVYVRSQGTAEERAATLEGLTAAAPFLRTALGRVLRLRRVPELRFRPDRSLEHAQRIEQVLSEVVVPDEGADSDDADGRDPADGPSEPRGSDAGPGDAGSEPG